MILPNDWLENDKLIRCGRLADNELLMSGVVEIKCDLCTHRMAAAPVTAAKQGKSSWHIICDVCFAGIVPGNQMLFKGRIARGDETLPE